MWQGSSFTSFHVLSANSMLSNFMTRIKSVINVFNKFNISGSHCRVLRLRLTLRSNIYMCIYILDLRSCHVATNLASVSLAYLHSDCFKGQSSQRCMKSKPIIFYDEKGRRTVFHISFSSVPLFSPAWILILKWEHLWRFPYFLGLPPKKIRISVGFIVHVPSDWTNVLCDLYDF